MAPINSDYAPVIENIENGELVHQRILLIYGRAGPHDVDFESNITVEHHANNFPSTIWQVFNSHFKCLVHLDPGLNNIKFILDTEPFFPDSQPLITIFQVNYVPLLQNPPIHLAILVAKDSNETIDAPEEKENSGDNKLEAVKAKFRLAGYLWQAFTAEQMNRHGFERRVFRLDEEWIEDTISNQDFKLRQTAKIHIIRSSYTLEQILDPQIAQQSPTRDDNKKDLYAIFLESLREHGAPFDKKCYVAGLILDSHYDPSPGMKYIRGHAALGGGDGNIQLGMFGSHLTHAWPKNLEEVVTCFQECTLTDESKLANDVGECGTWWKCCNVGIGAFLHEVGHGLGSPHTPSGIMLRGFNNLNRTFTVKEPNNPSPITPSDENGAHWHRCDAVRYRYHPCFRLPSDPPTSISLDNIGTTFWLLNEFILIKCPAGISLIEFYVEENIVGYIDYVENDQNEITLEIQEIKEKYGNDNHAIKMKVIAKNQTERCIENLQQFQEENKIILPIHGEAYKSHYLGKLDENLAEIKVLFTQYTEEKGYILLERMVVKYSDYIDSITFFLSDDTKLNVGSDDREGTEQEFVFEEGESIVEIKVNSGWYIDGFEIKTNLGRRSEWFGNCGGDDHVLKVPNNEFELIGLYGSGNYYVNTLGIIYKKS
ncbi:putative peptidase family-domain-containing protein [Glomus cerebriforme]|uniref:Putative peptidase family-domain-containing protein n=1 Tax=Glomus cerebriforme TaxID=658196 RepID=A0A397TL18_9GLOM|nr:putative peptidase family-domain-containing protein [Glomus cerebriforme]